MAYIYLEELKKILPGILDQWIDKDDESWEWIFQEIEQNCHVGKKEKKKKKVSKTDAIEIAIIAHRNDINELNKKHDELNNKISNLSDKYISMVEKVNKMYQDITAAKSMAETAKQRTEVRYDQINTKCTTCKHINKQALDQPCVGCCYNGINLSGTDKWEAKENE